MSKGKYDDSGFEFGKWQVFDKSSNQLMEEGNFLRGVRNGVWSYYTKPADTIDWLAFNDSSKRIRTNVPKFLIVVEQDKNLIKFSNLDSNRLFNLVIGTGYLSDTTSLAAYKKAIYDELQSRSVVILDSSTNYIETRMGNKYLFNSVSGGIKGSMQDFLLLNIVSRSERGLIEVSLRCDKYYDNKARKVFFSILPNLFIDSHRFISADDIITSIQTDLR